MTLSIVATTSYNAPDSIADIRSRAAKSGGAMFIAKSVRFIFLLIVNFILINLLQPADFGMGRYVLLVVGIANLLNEMGLTIAIVQREQFDFRQLWSLFLISSLWGILLYIIVYCLSPFIAWHFGTEELVLLLRAGGLMIPVTGITAVHRAWLRRTMEYGKLALIEMVAALVSAIVSVSCAFAGYGVWALVVGYLVFEGTISGILLITFRLQVSPLQTFRLLKPILFFGIAIIGLRVIDYILCNAPFYLIGRTIGKEGLGLFSVAHDIAVFPQTAINAVLAQVIVSTFSRVQTDLVRVSAGFGKLLAAGAFFTIPVLLVVSIMPEELLQIICVFKKNSDWLAAAPLLRWLGLTVIFYIFGTFSSSIWMSQGKIVESAGFSLLMCGATISAILIGAQWGLIGISVALFIRSVIVFPVLVYVNYRITGMSMRIFTTALIPPVTAGCIMAGVVIVVHHFIAGTTLSRHFITVSTGVFCGLVAYLGIMYLCFKTSLLGIIAMVRPS